MRACVISSRAGPSIGGDVPLDHGARVRSSTGGRHCPAALVGFRDRDDGGGFCGDHVRVRVPLDTTCARHRSLVLQWDDSGRCAEGPLWRPTEIEIDLAPLAALTEVRSLRMSRVKPLHTEVVGKLTKLETLELHRLLDARGLETLTELRVLEIPDSKITSLAFVANMPKLRVLDLAFAELQDLEGLRGHPSIEKLVLTWTKVTDLAVLTTLPKLRKLELLGATPSSWAPVGELVRLEELGLSRTVASRTRVPGTPGR